MAANSLSAGATELLHKALAAYDASERDEVVTRIDREAANVASLTDSTGGTADGTLADVGAAFSQATLNNNFADLAAKVNAIISALEAVDLMAT